MFAASRVTAKTSVSLASRTLNVAARPYSISSTSSLASKLPSTRTAASFASSRSLSVSTSSYSSSSSSTSSTSWAKLFGVLSAGVLAQVVSNKSTANAAEPAKKATKEAAPTEGHEEENEQIAEELNRLLASLLDLCSTRPEECFDQVNNATQAVHHLAGDSEYYASFLVMSASVLGNTTNKHDDTVLALFNTANDLYVKLYGDKDPRSTIGQYFLANHLIERGQVNEGVKHLHNVYQHFVQIFGRDHENSKQLADYIASVAKPA